MYCDVSIDSHMCNNVYILSQELKFHKSQGIGRYDYSVIVLIQYYESLLVALMLFYGTCHGVSRSLSSILASECMPSLS